MNFAVIIFVPYRQILISIKLYLIFFRVVPSNTAFFVVHPISEGWGGLPKIIDPLARALERLGHFLWFTQFLKVGVGSPKS